jgi:hypothetical protein
MPTSTGSDGMSEIALQAVCAYCGIVAVGVRSEVLETVGRHFVMAHEAINPVLEGRDFSLEAAPWRCDLCGVQTEPPFWQHTSTPPTSTGRFVDADGLWLACQTCHQLILAKNLAGLVRQHMEQTGINSPWMFEDLDLPAGPVGERRRSHAALSLYRAEMAERFRALLKNLDSGVQAWG